MNAAPMPVTSWLQLPCQSSKVPVCVLEGLGWHTCSNELPVLAAQVGRGEAVGAVWALTGGQHDTTALCVRDSEFVRMSRVRAPAHACSGSSFAARCLDGAQDWGFRYLTVRA